jgi:hypothetical protein
VGQDGRQLNHCSVKTWLHWEGSGQGNMARWEGTKSSQAKNMEDVRGVAGNMK